MENLIITLTLTQAMGLSHDIVTNMTPGNVSEGTSKTLDDIYDYLGKVLEKSEDNNE